MLANQSGSKFFYCLLMQMSSLVRLQLLTVVGDDHIDLPRYKCAVDFEFISTVARLVAITSVVHFSVMWVYSGTENCLAGQHLLIIILYFSILLHLKSLVVL
jgi:hypothetical protein